MWNFLGHCIEKMINAANWVMDWPEAVAAILTIGILIGIFVF